MGEINCVMFTLGTGNNGLAIARFRPNQGNEGVDAVNVPITGINPFTPWLSGIVRAAGRYDISQSVGSCLEYALGMIPRPNNNNQGNYEKMAIMVTNCTLNFGADFVTILNEFIRRDIILYVVATMTPCYEIWDNYDELARGTGGEYMLSQDAPNILERIIQLVIYEGYTLRQASLHIHAANTHNINEQNQTTDGVGELDFNHGLTE